MSLIAAACSGETQSVAGPATGADPTAVVSSSMAAPSPAVTTTQTLQTTVPSSEAPIVTVTPPSSTEPPEPPPPATTPPPSTGDIDPRLAPLVEIAVADLASRLGSDRGDITVVVAEMVVWPDGAVGCPQPGVEYTQVLVDGYRIVLGADGAEFAYHGGGTRGPFLCENPEG